MAFDFASGDKIVCEGSGNLRENGNKENLLIAHDAGLHDFHAAYIDAEVTKNEGK